MNGKIRTILVSCIASTIVCFIMGFIVARIPSIFNPSDMTIISEIEFLEKEVEKDENLKDFQKRLISNKNNDLRAESDENKRLLIYSEKKNYEKSLEKTELEIISLNKRIEKNYKKLRKRHPEFKESSDVKHSIDFAVGE